MAMPGRVGSATLDRRFEAIVLDWDGTAVPDRQSRADAIREAIERACRWGLDIVVISGTHVGNVGGQLAARPRPPGTLHLCLNRGSEVYRVGTGGARLLQRRRATADERRALDVAATRTIERLGEAGLTVPAAVQRLNRRKIDLIAEWADPPKAEIESLVAAVRERLAGHGIAGLEAVVAIALAAARSAGLDDARVTSDAKHVEIGLTDKSDSARWAMRWLWRRGIAPAQVLLIGDEFGRLGGVPGSDSLMLVSEGAGATAVSVGPEPAGAPAGVIHTDGGPERTLSLIVDQVERRAAGELPWIVDVPGWTLARPRGRDPAVAPLFAVADGRIGTVGLPFSSGRDPARTVLASGAYEGEGAESSLAPCPIWHRMPALAGRPSVDGVLDLHGGLLGYSTNRSRREQRMLLFSSRRRPGVVVLRAELPSPEGPAAPPMVPPSRRAADSGRVGDLWWVQSGGVAAAAMERRLGEDSVVDRFAAYRAGSGASTRRAAIGSAVRAGDAGFEQLLVEQRSAWSARWDDADVAIDGDDDLQLAIRFALFHLMASAADRGESAVGARGLSGRGYGGHVFWDADVFVLPFLAATHPASARAMLEYRIRRLPAAREAARRAGWKGARFPWESAVDGCDVTPSHVHDPTTGRVIPIRTGTLENHIVADVAWAAACYVDWTGDEGLWDSGGCELLAETARFWASRLRLDRDGRAHIYGVIGPDEYHEPVDDNAFTNVMARWNLRKAAEVCGAHCSKVKARERREWLSLADAIVDGYDPATGLYEQFSGYMGLERLIVEDVTPGRPVAADLLLGRERVAASQVIKQADVVMLHHMVPDEVAPDSLATNLAFYEPRTAHGSSLSPGIHAALLARVGDTPRALDALRLTSRIDLDDLTGTTATGLHLAAMGSLWQALAMGIAGVRPSGGELSVDPRPLDGWRGLEVRVRFRGSRVVVSVGQDRLELRASDPVWIAVGDGPRACVGPAGLRLSRVGQRWVEAGR